MTAFTNQETRNICIAGHGTTGKTTLTEALLCNMQAISRQGVVENGNTISDFTEEEVEKGVSISTAACSAEYKNKMVTILDTPGYFDFSGEMTTAIPFAETTVVTVKGTSGLDVGSESAYLLAKKYSKSVAFFINEIDKENTNVDQVINSLQSDLGINPAVLTLPATVGPDTNAIIDVLAGKLIRYADGKRSAIEDLPSDLVDMVNETKLKLTETIAENDEALMEKYFEQGELSLEEMTAGLRTAFSKGDLYPTFFGAQHLAIGTDFLLDSIVDFFPSPKDKPTFETPEGKFEYDENLPLKAIVFKVWVIPQFGEMYVTKILQGTLKENSDVYNSENNSAMKGGQIFSVFGKERNRLDQAVAGQIVALVKLKNTKTGDQFLADKSVKPFEFALMEWPEAIVRGAFTGSSKEDTDKIATGLKKLAD